MISNESSSENYISTAERERNITYSKLDFPEDLRIINNFSIIKTTSINAKVMTKRRHHNQPGSTTVVGRHHFKSQRVGYQSNIKLLDHYQHSKNQVNSYIHS